MAESYIFRSSISGFKKEDVVRYIEYLNAKHHSSVNQLLTEKQQLSDALAACQAQMVTQEIYEQAVAQRDAALAQVAELEQKLTMSAEQQARTLAEQELSAYRRAQQAEQEAKVRAQQMYQQAAAVLADATVQLDTTGSQLDAVSQQIVAQLAALQAAVDAGKAMLQEASSTISAIAPEEK